MSGVKFYESFFPLSDVLAFKRVKLGQMRLATVVRQTLASMIPGARIQKHGWEVVITPKGRWRVMMGENSENSIERAAREDAGLKALYVESDEALAEWFDKHGKDGPQSVIDFKKEVRRKLS
jgi:hypothetical protein